MSVTQENPTDEAQDVSFEDALAEENAQGGEVSPGNIDQPRPRPGGQPESGPTPEEVEAAKAQAEQAKEDLDLLAPKKESRKWDFGKGEFARSYVQRELSVVRKAQWFGLVGEILDKALSGDNALSLNSLLSPPQRRGDGSYGIADFQDADTFVHAVGKLLVYAPEFLEKSVCIWLSVPDYEWELARVFMNQSPEEGGMDDEMFEEIFATFIDQNYDSINRFFRQRFPRLRARWQARAKEANK